MLISEAFDQYKLDVIEFRSQSHKTEESHNVTLKALLKHFGDIDICDLTFKMVRDWKLSMDKRQLAPATSRYYIIRLRVVLTHLRLMGIDCLNPELVVVPKRGDRVPDFLAKEDVAKLIEAVLAPHRGYPPANRFRNAAIISLLYASGIRVTECANLNRSDIRDDGSFTLIGKGRKARLCFTDERTRGLIKQYLALRTDSNPALFICNNNGLRIRDKGIQEIFRLARTKAGFTAPIHPHTMRHSFATNLLRNRANIRVVQTLLGHSSLETTQIYTHVVDMDLREAYLTAHTV